jgi:hypothetical protein
MVVTYAVPCVARVKHFLTARNPPPFELPRETVSVLNPPLLPAAAVVETAIAFPIRAALPKPTLHRLPNASPKLSEPLRARVGFHFVTFTPAAAKSERMCSAMIAFVRSGTSSPRRSWVSV